MPHVAKRPSADSRVPDRTTYLVREIQGTRTAKQRFRQGRCHLFLGIALMAWFPLLVLSGEMHGAFPAIGGSVLMFLIGLQQLLKGQDELKLAKRRAQYERCEALVDGKVFD